MEGQQLSGNKENFKKIREVKKKIFAWEKLKKHLCGTFLPYNYAKLLYK